MPPEQFSPEKQSSQESAKSLSDIKDELEKAKENENFEKAIKLREERDERLAEEASSVNEQIDGPESEDQFGAEDDKNDDGIQVPDAPVQKETQEERREKIKRKKRELGMEVSDVDESEGPPQPKTEQTNQKQESSQVAKLTEKIQQLKQQTESAQTQEDYKKLDDKEDQLIKEASSLPQEKQAQVAESFGKNEVAKKLRNNPNTTLQEIRENQRQAQEQMIDERAKMQEKLDDRKQWLKEAMDSGDYKQAKQELENVYSVVRRSGDAIDVSTDVITAGRNLANELLGEHEFEDAFAVADKIDDESLKRKIENTETAATMKEAGADLANREIAKINNAERLDELDNPDDIIEVVDGLQDIRDSYTQAEDMNKHKQNAFFKVLNEKRSEAREAAQDWLESAFAELDQQSQEIVDSMEQAAENLPEEPDQPVSLSEAVAYQNNLQEAMNGGRNDVGVRKAGLAAQVDNFRNHKGMRGDFLDKRDQMKRVQDGLRNADPDMHIPQLRLNVDQKDAAIIEAGEDTDNRLLQESELSPVAQLDVTFRDVLYPAYEKANEQLPQADELIKQAFREEMTDLRRQVDDLEEGIQLEGPSLSELQSDLMQARQERKESWFGSDSKSDKEKEIEAKISQREAALSEAREEIGQLQSQVQELCSQAPEEFADKVRDLENSLTHKRNHLES